MKEDTKQNFIMIYMVMFIFGFMLILNNFIIDIFIYSSILTGTVIANIVASIKER